MRRTIAIIALLALPSLAWAATLPFTPTITLTAPTSSTVRIQLAGLRATGIDTIKVYSSGADSLTGPKYWFKASVTKDTTVVVAPGKFLTWKVRADSAGTYKTSVPDTAQVPYPQVEPSVLSTVMDDWRSAALASAWPPTSSYSYTWTLRTASALDSSMVYEVWPYTGCAIVATGDSAKVKVRVMGGFNDSLGNPYFAPVDSLDITAKGTVVKSWSIPVGCRHFYYELFGATGNGNTTSLAIYNRRFRR